MSGLSARNFSACSSRAEQADVGNDGGKDGAITDGSIADGSSDGGEADGGSDGGADASWPDGGTVKIQKVDGRYYKIEIDMKGMSRYDMGRLYAMTIKENVPDFEQHVDTMIKSTIDKMKEFMEFMDFSVLVERAQVIFPQIPQDYREEIRGMQSVFSSTDDTVGNGKISKNKLLVYEIAPDVARLITCSASAAFGDATENGRTILARSLEWYDNVLPPMAALNAVTVIHNGAKSVVLIGFVGQLSVVSGFNSTPLFTSILDSDIGWFYLTSENTRSYVMDLRYALENQSTIKGVAKTFNGWKYAYNFNVFIADKNSAAVSENDVFTPFSGLRTSTSPVKTDTWTEIKPWTEPNAIACVNWFTLEGTADNSSWFDGNAPRWESFIDLYAQYLSQGKITVDVIKEITEYAGPDDNGKSEDGAIWRYEDIESEIQVIIMNMDTFETWISFQPPDQPPLKSPQYIKVFSASPFQAK